MPSQDLLDLHFDRWSRVVSAEPILDGRFPQRYRATPAGLTLYTTNAVVIQAWNEMSAPTGDAIYDGAEEALGGYSPISLPSDGPGEIYMSVKTDRWFNEELLDTRLRDVSTRLPTPTVVFDDDGDWTWDSEEIASATATINFQFGWGDCPSGCTGMHYLRAIVSPDGEAIVYDLGGDPIPNEYVGPLSPNTRPL